MPEPAGQPGPTMTPRDEPTSVGSLPETSRPRPRLPAALTALTWALFVASLAPLGILVATGATWRWGGLLAVDGLTVVVWTAATFLSGLVHSYARRYMAGDPGLDRFFTRLTGFTLAVLVLVAADHIALFAAAWLAMGLVMADLIGHARDWPQAQAAADLARRSFLASTALLAAGLAGLWWITGSATVTGIASAAAAPPAALGLAAGALLAAAVIQSALVPFHTWLLSSMTAPTPASALMHAGFVNAGGILLARFAGPLLTAPLVLEVAVVFGASSAIAARLVKSVQPDAKRQLGCSTASQMGFMVLQAGLGFLGAAVTHLILHGFYKAYMFLSVGDRVQDVVPDDEAAGGTGPLGLAVTLATALAGGALFAALTGKGTHLDAGLVLTILVVLTTLHATREVVSAADVPKTLRLVAFPATFLTAIALYAGTYLAIVGTIGGSVTAPADLTALHGAVAAAYVAAYVAAETGIHRRSDRLYVALLNAGQPAPETTLTERSDYDAR